MLNTTSVVKAKQSPTFNLTTLEERYSTEVAVCIQEKDTRCELDPDTWRELATLVYLSNANRAKSSIVIQVANEAKTAFVFAN